MLSGRAEMIKKVMWLRIFSVKTSRVNRLKYLLHDTERGTFVRNLKVAIYWVDKIEKWRIS